MTCSLKNLCFEAMTGCFLLSGLRSQVSGLPTPVFPELSFEVVREMIQPAMALALLAAIESLLSAVASNLFEWQAIAGVLKSPKTDVAVEDAIKRAEELVVFQNP